MDIAIIIGTLAALCSVTSFAPQAWKIIITRDTSSISARMYILTVAGFAFWTTYGVLLSQWPIIAPNAICFCLAGFILFTKLYPGKKDDLIERINPEKP